MRIPIFVFVAICWAAISVNAGTKTSKEIWVVPTIVSVDDSKPATVRITVTNRSDSEVSLSRFNDLPKFEAVCIRPEDNKVVAYTWTGMQTFGPQLHGCFLRDAVFPTKIPAHGSRTFDFSISDYFEISEPGDYRFIVTLPRIPELQITNGEVRFRVGEVSNIIKSEHISEIEHSANKTVDSTR